MAVLEDQHEQAERGAQRQQIHDQRLDRQDDRPCQYEEQDERRHDENRKTQRQVRRQTVSLIDERGGVASDNHGERRLHVSDSVDEPPARGGKGSVAWDDIDPPETGTGGARALHGRSPRELLQPLCVSGNVARGGAGRFDGDIESETSGSAGSPLRARHSPARALADFGKSPASTPVNLMPRKGIPSAIITAALPTAKRMGLRITVRASRDQNP